MQLGYRSGKLRHNRALQRDSLPSNCGRLLTQSGSPAVGSRGASREDSRESLRSHFSTFCESLRRGLGNARDRDIARPEQWLGSGQIPAFRITRGQQRFRVRR